MKIVIDAFEEKVYEDGDYVIKQGDDGDFVYVVGDGVLECYKTFDPNEGDKLLKQYKPGDVFGELALLYNSPRAASILCKSQCKLYALDRETFNNIVKEAAIKKRDQYNELFGRIELLSSMDPYERSKIADSLKMKWFKAGEYVVKQGEQGDNFYFVEKGTAKAMKAMKPGDEPVQVFDYKIGDYFGELSLLKSEPRQASIIATGDLKVCYMDRQSFQRLLGPLEDILKRNMAKYELYKQQ